MIDSQSCRWHLKAPEVVACVRSGELRIGDHGDRSVSPLAMTASRCAWLAQAVLASAHPGTAASALLGISLKTNAPEAVRTDPGAESAMLCSPA
jgi:hypothetical protein